MEKVIKYFLDKTISNLDSNENNITFIKFVFSDDALDEMSKYNEQTVNYLREIKNNYILGRINKDDTYIEVNDYKEFFSLLNQITQRFRIRKNNSILNSYNIIRSIWLRMSPSDINDVNDFLKKQLSFLKNDDILPYYKKFYKNFENIGIYYENKANEDWFETNNNVTFSFIKNIGFDEMGLPIDYQYDLPSIHYSFIKENDEAVCYIYGIQNISNEKDSEIKEIIQPLRKQLQNKYVSPDFILALKIFVDFLSDNKIYNIKVPLLQVMNYSFHESLSESIEKAYSSYEDKNELEKKYEEGNRDDLVLDYIHDKKMYEKFVDKADLISKNKTERLINTFQVLNELFGNIEFMNEPFIQGDYLIIKINKELGKER